MDLGGDVYSTSNTPMIPFYIYYSMFGFQRVSDLAWAAGDMRARGFLDRRHRRDALLSTAKVCSTRTGIAISSPRPSPTASRYDPTFTYEVAVIVQDGLRRMLTEQEDVFYYLTTLNENYQHPAMPEGAAEGIIKGMYLLKAAEAGAKGPRVQLLGSGSILREALAGAELLRKTSASPAMCGA